MRLATVRFVIGASILLLVDVLWVASSEITEYLYHEKNFNKPFFTAYVKSIMFSIYIVGFFFCDSWWSSYKSFSLNRLPDYYSSIADTDQQNLTMDDEDEDEEELENDDQKNIEREITLENNEFQEIDLNQPNVSINCNIDDVETTNENKSSASLSTSTSSFIGDSMWLPIKHCSDNSSLSGRSDDDDSISGDVTIESLTALNKHSTDSLTSSNDHKMLISNMNVNFKKKKNRRNKRKCRLEESNIEESSLKNTKSKRSVRFSKLIEVRTLSEKHAEDAYISRLSYSAFMRHIYNKTQHNLTSNNESSDSISNSSDFEYRGPKLNVKDTALLAFYFTPIWFAANLSFHVGLQYSEAGLVNVLSSTTPLFTLLLSIIFPSGSNSDNISLTKLLGVLVFISSVAIISTSEPINHSHSQPPTVKPEPNAIKLQLLNETVMPLGSIWSLVGAFFYAVYIVLMRYNVMHDGMLNFPMFFGFIGLFSLILMWPIILLLNFTQLELFEWPTREQWLLILVNGLCGTVISELLWLWGSFMTSSLVGTISISFTIPMAVYFDVFFKDIEYPRLFFLGTIPMFSSFIIIILVSQYDNWDPILAILEKCVRFIGVNTKRTNGNSYRNPNVSSLYESQTVENESSKLAPSLQNVSTNVTQSSGAQVQINHKNSMQASSSGSSKSPVNNNNRRFDGKIYRQLKKSDCLINSSIHQFDSEDQEQSQSLIEAEDDSAYA